MNPLISVIVPVYNSELYLNKCVNSIIGQTYTNLEIILVDDGSTDRSSQMCDQFAEKDSRIKVIHKTNGGLSSARNEGLNVCQGDYIGFVDSDDWIEPDMYFVLLKQLEIYNTDLAVSGRYDVYENSQTKTIGKCPKENGLFDMEQILPKMMIGQASDFSVWDKLYRKNLWEDIRFPEGEIYEDLAVMYKVLIAAKKVVLCNKPFYNYYHHSCSIVTSGFNETLLDYPKQTKQLLFDISSWYPEYVNYAIWSHIKAVQAVLTKLLSSDKETYDKYNHLYEKYIQEIKSYSSVWKKSDLFSTRDRLICVVLLNKRIARFILYFKKKIKR